jgi:hypothetical protein
MRLARQESIIDEEVFLDLKFWITTLKVAGAVVAYAMAQNEILGARRGADRICLHKAQAINRARKCHGTEQGSSHRISAKVCKGERAHSQDANPIADDSRGVSSGCWRVAHSGEFQTFCGGRPSRRDRLHGMSHRLSRPPFKGR